MIELQTATEFSYALGQKQLAKMLAKMIEPMIDEIANYADGMMFEFSEDVDANCEEILRLCDEALEILEELLLDERR